MGTPGRKRRVEPKNEYWRLLMSDIGTVEACREVGIGRKTGFRWRREMGGAPPVRHVELEAPGRYLSRVERHRIATLSERGHGVREIARRLGRAPSTISPELSRNRVSRESLTYDSDVAHALATQRARRPKQLRLYVDTPIA